MLTEAVAEDNDVCVRDVDSSVVFDEVVTDDDNDTEEAEGVETDAIVVVDVAEETLDDGDTVDGSFEECIVVGDAVDVGVVM